MKSKLGFLVLAFSLVLTGCPSIAPNHVGVTQISASGDYIHAPSKFVFPENFGQFNRVSVVQYDEEGNNVSAGYNLDTQLKIALTLYVRSAPEPIELERHFQNEVGGIVEAHPGATILGQWVPPTTQNGESDSGYAAVFEYEQFFAGSARTVNSDLYLFVYDGWFVKYRITYPKSQREDADLISQVFVSSFIWRNADKR